MMDVRWTKRASVVSGMALLLVLVLIVAGWGTGAAYAGNGNGKGPKPEPSPSPTASPTPTPTPSPSPSPAVPTYCGGTFGTGAYAGGSCRLSYGGGPLSISGTAESNPIVLCIPTCPGGLAPEPGPSIYVAISTTNGNVLLSCEDEGYGAATCTASSFVSLSLGEELVCGAAAYSQSWGQAEFACSTIAP